MKQKHKHHKKPLTPKSQVTIALAIIAAITLITLSGIALMRNTTEAIRLSRIKQIYSRLDLGSDFIFQHANVFGDKRIYDWDKGRSYSSEVDYLVGKNVDVTVAEARAAIESEGFTYFEEPYPGSAFTELHFKSANGEYIRLNVSSKSRNDAFQNASLMKQDTSAAAAIDPNAGPSDVVIKVNLDDNNE